MSTVLSLSPSPSAQADAARGSAHYLGLDGLRGIAAGAVMLLHVVGFYAPGRLTGISAAMAVDLFFMLSGFVLAHAYGAKLDAGMSWTTYLKIRLIRLYPMIFIGVMIGATLVVGKLSLRSEPLDPGVGPIDFLCSLALIPIGLIYPLWHYYLGGPVSFMFDRPMWSLFFEIVASAAFGVAVIRNPPKGIFFATFALAAALLSFWAMMAGTMTILGIGGPLTFAGGFLRVGVPFTLGVMLYRRGWAAQAPQISMWLLAIFLAGLLLAPVPASLHLTYEFALAFGVFPIVILLGARVSLTDLQARFCSILGMLSYPIYLLHDPIGRLVGFIVKQRFPQPEVLIVASLIGTVLASWLILRWIDEPVRRALRKRLIVKIVLETHAS